jgi:glycerophosphoryl diester phosphodiesterase
VRSAARILLPGLLAFLLATPAFPAPAEGMDVIAHRGASGYLPEHTLEAYAFAYAAGADFIEADLVLSRDGVLVARHDLQLEDSTDVERRYPDRRAEDGHFYAADFDWAELATLRAVERRPGRFPEQLAVLSLVRFEDLIDLVAGLNRATGCRVGLYPELKAPAWHEARGLDPVAALRRAFADHAFEGPLRIQSFEAAPLLQLSARPLASAELVQLIPDEDGMTPVALNAITGYAQRIGPPLALLAEARARGDDAVARAHDVGLRVDAWTLRADAPSPFADLAAGVAFAVDVLALDGLFTDHPDQVRALVGPASRRALPCTTPDPS